MRYQARRIWTPIHFTRLAGLLLVTVLAMPAAFPAAAGPRETGLWIDDTGKGAVQIEVCGGSKLCGRIVWLKEPLNAQGEPLTDKYNPQPERRARPICGLPILGELQQLPEGGYDGGWVYDPKVGKAYDVAIELIAPDRLQVTGYKGVRLLGKSFLWTRAEGDLPNCAVTPASAPQKAAPAAGAKKTGGTSAEVLPWSSGQKPKTTAAKPTTATKPTTAAKAKADTP